MADKGNSDSYDRKGAGFAGVAVGTVAGGTTAASTAMAFADTAKENLISKKSAAAGELTEARWTGTPQDVLKVEKKVAELSRDIERISWGKPALIFKNVKGGTKAIILAAGTAVAVATALGVKALRNHRAKSESYVEQIKHERAAETQRKLTPA